MLQGNSNIRYDDGPSILAFADTETGRSRAAALIDRSFGRDVRVQSVEHAAAQLDEVVRTDAVFVDIRGDGGDAVAALVERLDGAAREGRFASVVCLAPGLIDDVAAHALHRDVALLVDPSAIEQEMALGLAIRSLRPPPPLWMEEESAPGLRELSEEVGRIARTLAALSAAPEQRGQGPQPDRPATVEPSAATVRAAIRARRLREQFFDGRLFADPAWDMLLDLMAARLERCPVAVSSLCIAAAVPPTTALRWMKQLTEEGLFVRVADPRDGRRIFIELSDSAAAGLSAYFQALGRMGVMLP